MRLVSNFFILVIVFITSCQDTSYTPKPRAYPKVEYPERSYSQFEEPYCSFNFQYPSYTVIQRDTNPLNKSPLYSCWFDLYYPNFDSRIYFTYYPIGVEKSFEELKIDAFEMADWHNKKANYIEEYLIDRPNKNVFGLAFDIDGPAASPFQFFVTDSVQHFLRGSVYFNTKIQADSLAPVINFVRQDALKIIETIEWK